MNWIDFGNEGVIQSYTVVKVPLSRMEGLHPYTVVVVTLDDGPRISGLLLDVDAGEKISVGDRVIAEFRGDDEEISLHFKLLNER
jgi:uncharacterized OB-fold protein